MANHDFKVTRGDNRPVAWRFKLANGSLFDMTGSELILTITHRGEPVLTKSTVTNSSVFGLDVAAATATWTPTTAETLSMPLGRKARYELERVIGPARRQLLKGYVIADD